MNEWLSKYETKAEPERQRQLTGDFIVGGHDWNKERETCHSHSKDIIWAKQLFKSSSVFQDIQYKTRKNPYNLGFIIIGWKLISDLSTTNIFQKAPGSEKKNDYKIKWLNNHWVLNVCVEACRPPTGRLGAVGVLNGQFELLDEVCPVQSPLLPDVQQPLHGLLTAPICLPTDQGFPREFTSSREHNQV